MAWRGEELLKAQANLELEAVYPQLSSAASTTRGFL